ncbi:unnamed protein product, partial [Closterium sp. NIES-64]
ADGLPLFDLTSGASPAPAAPEDATVRSVWATRDAAARLAVRRHLPPSERAHFGSYKSAQTLYDAVIARYSTPATAALSRLMLLYLFPDLASFATVADLITHLRTSDAHFRAALPADLPTTLTVNLLEKSLLVAEKSILAVGASRGDPRTPIFEGCSPSPLLPSVASAATADLVGFESVGAASAPSGRRRSSKGKGGRSGGGGGGGGGSGGGGSGGGGGGSGSGVGSGGVSGGSGGGGGSGVVVGVEAEAAVWRQRRWEWRWQRRWWRRRRRRRRRRSWLVAEEWLRWRSAPTAAAAAWSGDPLPPQLREWYAARQRGGGTGPCTYVLRTGDRAGEPCGGPHPAQRCFGRMTDAWRRQFPDASEIPRWDQLSRAGVAIFDLDFDAILAAMYAVTLAAAPGAGEAVALGASESVSSGAGDSALSGTASAPPSLTFTLDSGASRSFFRDRTTLTPLSRPVAVSLADPSGGPVLARYSTVLPCLAVPSGALSGLYLPSFSTNLVAGADLQDAGVDQFTPARRRDTHCTDADTDGSPLPASSPGAWPLAFLSLAFPGPSLPFLRGLALPVSPVSRVACGLPSLLPVSSSDGGPMQTLHMDVWGPARVRGQGHERYFLLVVDDYSRYTTVFPLRSKGEVTEVLIDWIRAARLQLRRSFGSDFPVLRLHSDRGGQPSAQGLQTGDLSSFAVDGEGWRCVGVPCLGISGVCPRLVCDKLSPRAAPCVFLGFPPDAPGWQFYHPTSRRVLSSQDVTFDESVPFYRLFPTASVPPPPPAPLPGPRSPPVDPLPPSGSCPFRCVSAWGVLMTGGAELGGAEPGGAVPGGAEPGGAEPGGAVPVGVLRPGGSGSASGSAAPAASVPGGSPDRLHAAEPLSPLELLEWVCPALEASCWSRGTGGCWRFRCCRGRLVPRVPEVLVLRVLELPGPGVPLELGAAAGELAAEATTVGPTAGTSQLLVVLELELLSGAVCCLWSYSPPLPCLLLLPTLVLQEVLLSVVSLRLALRRQFRAARSSGHGSQSASSSCPWHTPDVSASVHCSSACPFAFSSSVFSSYTCRPESDSRRAASPTVTRLLASLVTDPSFESAAASALVAELVDFAAACRLDYAASLGCMSLLSLRLLRLRLPVLRPSGVTVLLARTHPDPTLLRRGDGQSPTPLSGSQPWTQRWLPGSPQAPTLTLSPLLGANIVSGMWIFRVKRPPGSPPVFKARYVARGFSQRQGVDFFQTFSPDPEDDHSSGSTARRCSA